MPRVIALIAHDGKKPDMVRFVMEQREKLALFDLVATGSTGKMVEEATGLAVRGYRHGPSGGDVQIAAELIQGNFAAVFFFVEPMEIHPHDPDIQTLLRICNIENVPLATNTATARLVVEALTDED
jgi:methylglyoxal synthase